MKVLKRPVFLLDVAESADYLFMEGGEDVWPADGRNLWTRPLS
jgi:hypothetical protein